MPEHKYRVGDRIAVTEDMLDETKQHGVKPGDLGTIVGLHPHVSGRQYYCTFDEPHTFPMYGNGDNLPLNECLRLGIRPENTFYMSVIELDLVQHAEPTQDELLFT